MIISDLSYLQTIKDKESSVVVGGYAYADTFATTTAVDGYAHTSAGAVGIGDNALADTQIRTRVGRKGRFNYSRGKARAIAYANTGEQTDSSTSSSDSLWLNVNNRTIELTTELHRSR